MKVKVRVNINGIISISSATLLEPKENTDEEPEKTDETSELNSNATENGVANDGQSNDNQGEVSGAPTGGWTQRITTWFNKPVGGYPERLNKPKIFD